MMKKKPGFKLLAMVCVFALLSSCGFSVLAEEPLTPFETVPPQYASDYFLNMHFTGIPNGSWSGGGLAVETVAGKWDVHSSVRYSAEHDVLSLGGMEATLDQPITNEGTYVFETDIMAPDFAFTADGKCRFDIMVSGVYAARIFHGGSMDLAGKSEVFTMEPSTWYTVRFLIDLSSHTYKAQVILKNTREVKAEASNIFGPSGIENLRMWQTVTAEKPLYTQNWKFYKNDTGKVQTLDFIRPSDPAGYYINVAVATTGTWSSETADIAGNWKYSSGVCDQENGWVELGNGQNFQADITQPALETSIDGKLAGLTKGAYVTEMDFRVGRSEESTGDINVVTTGAVLQRSGGPDSRNPELINVAADTGMITLFAKDAGTSVNTNQAVSEDTWYTAKALMDLDKRTLTAEVLERDSGAVIARGSSTMSEEWLLLTTVFRSLNKAQNATLYTQNFKFYPKSEPSNVPPAVFRDAEGTELRTLPSSGTVAVVPALLKTSKGTMDCVYIAALYKQTETGEKSLVQAQTQAYSVYGDSPVIWSPNEAISFEIPDDEADYLIKCYVWDSFEEIEPLTETAELD